jgi:signal transduction histidine kinase
MNDSTEIFISFAAGSIILLILTVFIISFLFLFQRRQEQNIQEKANLKAQFEQEILTSENEIKEETMRYISRELHDNVVQMLSLVKIQLNGVLADDPNNQAATQSKEYLTGAITDLRALSKTLNTDNILHEGLANTIRFELQRIEKISTIQTEFNENTTKNWLDRKQEIVVFRIFQELMQNIVKHAQAKNITVFLEDNVDFFKLEVQDDGIGFDFEEKLKNRGFDSGSGLVNMVYRASLLKGSFKVLKVDSGGSLSTLLIPLKLHNDQHRPH